MLTNHQMVDLLEDVKRKLPVLPGCMECVIDIDAVIAELHRRTGEDIKNRRSETVIREAGQTALRMPKLDGG